SRSPPAAAATASSSRSPTRVPGFRPRNSRGSGIASTAATAAGPSAASGWASASSAPTSAPMAARSRSRANEAAAARSRSGCLSAGKDRLTGSRAGTTEKQDVAVGVLELESPQAITRILEWFGELDTARREFCRQRIRIGNIEVGVPTSDTLLNVSRVVRHRVDADGLEHDHRGAAADDAGEDAARFRPLKHDVEPEPIAVERKCGGDILHDEERRDP